MTTIETHPAIVPNFDEETGGGRTLAIICSKGNLDMAYPGLVLANAALGEGVDTHMFFTFWGFDMITKSRMDNLQFSPAGNAAMHLPIGDAHLPQALAPLPGMTAMATRMLKKSIAELGVPEVPEFLDQIVAAGGQVENYPYVSIDDRAAGRQAVDHLIFLGHRRIGMIAAVDQVLNYVHQRMVQRLTLEAIQTAADTGTGVGGVKNI